MSTEPSDDHWLINQLNRHPHLKNRIQSLLQLVENANGDVKLADAAERRVIEEIRQMGHDALEAWAVREVERTEEELAQAKGLWRNGKKRFAGTPPLERSK